MKSLLLILILFGDPDAAKLAQGVADDLTRVGGDNAKVLVGPAAVAELEKRGVKVADLIASPNIAKHLTESDINLAVVHIGREVEGGDVVAETRLWIEGRGDRHVAIAGNGGDPLPAVVNGLMTALAHRLPNARPQAPIADETQLAALASRGQWEPILGQVAGVAEAQRTPRQWYYLVLAYAKLGQRDAAVDALNGMRKAHPDHFLIKAAEDVVPSESAAAATPATPEKDDKEASDAMDRTPVPAATDDGGNTLR